jgi:hypothetical protein
MCYVKRKFNELFATAVDQQHVYLWLPSVLPESSYEKCQFTFAETSFFQVTQLITWWSIVILEKLTVAQLDNNFLVFMKLEGSFRCSQEPASVPYPEPDESSPHVLKIILHLHLGLLSDFFSSDFPIKILYAFLIFPLHLTYHIHLSLFVKSL